MPTKDKETDRINTRINHDIKARAQNELAKNGLTISEYMRIVLTGVANYGLPTHFAQPSKEVIASILEMTDVVSGNKKPENVAHSREELNQMLES
ncbi:type II toxin-antitoxin system RelB/DinJ family antitoxin [Levilactobacillus lanxiensis]|uniref:Type II toxin-antitoxin system RelB/DinJ family antitoxin n=1 Tax=Levilactobacillus lanxiensis TaxID=2799568 RepID=A0ABW4D4Z2_9LACO|nr:type II toxin-antitoxin system RelB/DinJ family antitoxin [Levilactobacillus lanxiensis]